MSFFGKLFNKSSKKPKISSKDKKIQEKQVFLSLDDLFVNNFINKGGKFLYCVNEKEIIKTLHQILEENNWKSLSCIHKGLIDLCNHEDIVINHSIISSPFFTYCEHMIGDTGNLMFSSNQLRDTKLNQLNQSFIVLAKTSQLVKNMGEGLTGIKTNSKDKIPTNICTINDYNPGKQEESFLNYGNKNSKNMYLILLEDL